MNYGDLLYRAHENKCNVSNKEVRCYKTSFAPPKKLTKSKVSSDNIKKFLARREEEEKKKVQEAHKKKQELLALRSQDKKAQKRVQVMLKRTKSANKSVMEDAIDNVNTADTLDGPNQCDDDDYGYVSQEASALYNKLMNKYENMPPEPSLFSKGKKEVKDLAAAKDRVKLALQKEAEEAELPHKRKKKSKQEPADDFIQDSDSDDDETTLPQGMTEKKKDKSDSKSENKNSKQEIGESSKQKIKKHHASVPPPPNFNELLKIAKEKQHEPIVIDTNKIREPTRLMTSKEKAEYMREEERKRNRLLKERGITVSSTAQANKPTTSSDVKTTVKETQSKDLPGEVLQKRIPKLLDRVKEKEKEKEKPDLVPKIDRQPSTSKKVAIDPKSASDILKKSSDVWQKPCNVAKKNINGINKKPTAESSKSGYSEKPTTSTSTSKKKPEEQSSVPQYVPKPKVNINKELSDIDKEIELLRRKKELLAKKAEVEQASIPKYVPTTIKPQAKSVSADPLRTKEKIIKKKPVNKKRCIESDSDRDSEMDDFIDDGGDATEDYSKVISEIFGYDKSRYRDVDEDDDDDCMESNFAQQMREEFVSSKIGLMEDLEDIRKEQEEKRRMKARKKLKIK